MSAYPNPSLAFLPPHLRRAVQIREHAENRDEWISRAGERIEADADKVRELVTDNAGAIDDPMCSAMASDLVIALRELRPVFDRLCHGDTLEAATKTPDEAQHFRTLLRASETADGWIAKLIDQEAASQVDAPEEFDE